MVVGAAFVSIGAETCSATEGSAGSSEISVSSEISATEGSTGEKVGKAAKAASIVASSTGGNDEGN